LIRLKPRSEGGLLRNPYKLNKRNRGVSGNAAFQLADLEFGIGFKARVTGFRQNSGVQGGPFHPLGDPKAHLPADEVVKEARKMALTILEKNPKLTWEDHKNLRESLMAKFQPLLDLAQIS
jgi:hypothetical protein